jgi:hypothetical protein
MERQVGAASQRFADYCQERGVDEDEAVIAMTVTCHLDALQTIDRHGYGEASITKQPCHLLQRAGILRVGMGGRQSTVDWAKVEYFLGVGKRLRE